MGCTNGGRENTLDQSWRCVSDQLLAYPLKLPPTKHRALHCTECNDVRSGTTHSLIPWSLDPSSSAVTLCTKWFYVKNYRLFTSLLPSFPYYAYQMDDRAKCGSLEILKVSVISSVSLCCNNSSFTLQVCLVVLAFKGKGKGKSVPLQAWSGPKGSRKLRFPGFVTTAQDGGKVVSLTHLPPLPPGNAPGTHFC